MAKRNPNLTVVGGPGPAKPGHNSELTEDQKRALHLNNHVPAYERALKAKKDADASFKNVCKTIKSDGGDIDQVKLTISLRTPEGEQKFKELLARQQEIARWNNLPIGSQGWLLDEDRRPIVDRAYEEGKKAGFEGKDCAPGHAAGTEAHDAWIKGWHESQAVLAQGFKPTQPVSDVIKPQGSGPAVPDDFDHAATGGSTD